jgi:hypothetical protein
MARYKGYDYSQGKFIPIQFACLVLAGTYEYTLHYLVGNEIDLSVFDLRYRNDETGAPAYDPAILFKVIFYTYSWGITLSRGYFFQPHAQQVVAVMSSSSGTISKSNHIGQGAMK